jgi:hypothetical protein
VSDLEVLAGEGGLDGHALLDVLGLHLLLIYIVGRVRDQPQRLGQVPVVRVVLHDATHKTHDATRNTQHDTREW